LHLCVFYLILLFSYSLSCFFFFFTAPSPTDIYPLSLHDALPIFTKISAPDLFAAFVLSSNLVVLSLVRDILTIKPLSSKSFLTRLVISKVRSFSFNPLPLAPGSLDRKSTRLNSSHVSISYAVFCLKKKNKQR